jgi:hypothetical protein
LALGWTAIHLLFQLHQFTLRKAHLHAPPKTYPSGLLAFSFEVSKCRTLSSAQPIDNTRFIEIVRRHLDFDPVAYSEADEPFPHLARNVGKNEVLIFELNAEHGSG